MSILDQITVDDASNRDTGITTLAPPPVDFKREYFRFDGKTYRIDYDGTQAHIFVRPRHGMFFHENEVPGDYDWSGYAHGCLIAIGFSVFFWGMAFWVIKIIWRKIF